MALHCSTFTFLFIPLFLIQSSLSDNFSLIVPSSFSGLPSASTPHAEAISDEGFAIFAMAHAIPKLALLSGLEY
jgi:hypothetical protein